MKARHIIVTITVLGAVLAGFVAGRSTIGSVAGRTARTPQPAAPYKAMSVHPISCADAFGWKKGSHDCWFASMTGFDRMTFGSATNDAGQSGLLLSTLLEADGFEFVLVPDGYGDVRIYHVDLETRRLCIVNFEGRIGQVDFNGQFAKITPEAGCPPVG